MLARLERLQELLQKKAAIEERISSRTSALERAYLDANQELSVSVKGRVSDIATLDEVCAPIL